jgi:TRAP-type C4-dicarboxylate transport system permease small subunit
MDTLFVRRLTRMLEWLLIALSATISIVVFLQVLFRYVLSQPLFWSEELPRYLLIWTTFLAAALAQKHRAHINITLAVTLLPPTMQRWLRIVVDAAILAFLGILVYSGSTVSRVTLYHRSTALQIPMAAVYLALPVGGALMMLYLLLQIIQDLKSPHA